MSANNVLVVDADVQRRETLSTLITFINCQPVLVDEPDNWFDAIADLNDVVMAIVGDCGDSQQTRELLRTLVNHEAAGFYPER